MALYVLAVFLAVLSRELVVCRSYDYPNSPAIIPPSRYDQSPATNDYAANDVGQEESRTSDESRNQNEISSYDFDSQKEMDDWQNSVPGVAGKDYPNLKKIPNTSFSCAGKKPGYYADLELNCQVFHVCNARGVKSSFLCSPGSIFNQKYFVCDWWYDVECENAVDLYSLNEQFNRAGDTSGPSKVDPGFNDIEYQRYDSPRKDYRDSSNSIDLSLAGTGEGASGYSMNHKNDTSKSYQEETNERNSEAAKYEKTNFPGQSIDSSNRRENGFPGSGGNYLSAAVKDWGANSRYDRNELSSFNEKTLPKPTFNNQHQTFSDEANFFLGEHRVLDNVPRGFSKNYKNDDLDDDAGFFNQQQSRDSSSDNFGRGGGSDLRPGIIYSEARSEDELDRKIQKEVDDTVLYKNRQGHSATSTTYDDYEANELTYEKPPPRVESYYSQYHVEPEPPLPTKKNNFNEGEEKGKSPQGSSRIRPTGGLKDGLGNGLPSSNRELVGSNAIAGIGEPKLSLGQDPDYAERYPIFGNQRVPQYSKF